MKKSLLFTVLLGVSVAVAAQVSPQRIKPGIQTVKHQVITYDDVDLTKTPSIVNSVQVSGRGTNDISIVDLGTSANAFGLYNGGRTALWADPVINSVAFFHRMGVTPGSGFVAYDVSKDGGNTWVINQQIFNPNAGGTAPARYPQGVIYNPQGNTDPNNAYATAFFPTLDGSNAGAGSWGGYGVASQRLDGANTTQAGWPSDAPIRQNVPDAMTINPVSGDIFVVDPSQIDGLGDQYVDTLVITRGIWDATANAYEYEQTLLYAPVNAYGTAIADCRIAFAPDGQVGYIMTLSDNGEDPMATTVGYYPILYKTTDGGNTWDETPITVPLGGSDGLAGIVNDLLTDAQIAELFAEPLPARDEITYTTAFTSDFAVDSHGDPVISVVIGVAGSENPYEIVTEPGTIASYNIYGNGQGEDWYAQKLGQNLRTFRGTWGEVIEDNRSQVTTTMDGTKMFFSWLDTHFEGVAENLQPDIYLVGWDVETNMYTPVDSVTYLSDAWLQAFMATASYYAFEPTDGSYVIPFVYQAMEPSDPALPVTYKYIRDYTVTNAQFTIENAANITPAVASVSQNYPNPFKGSSEITVNLEKKANVGLEVFNMVGQKVFDLPTATLAQGTHKLIIDAKNLNAGFYTYSVVVNGERITKKMVIE